MKQPLTTYGRCIPNWSLEALSVRFCQIGHVRGQDQAWCGAEGRVGEWCSRPLGYVRGILIWLSTWCQSEERSGQSVQHCCDPGVLVLSSVIVAFADDVEMRH